jgi:2-methylaconitate cis-trans-isomerase PrpF
MRGGTSRALFFERDALPALDASGNTTAWDEIFCRALGSPDPNRRQLDGMGGGITSLSKIAVIGRPTHPDADIDYTFAQVDVTSPVVGYRGNCGNISSAVGPYAVDRGMVPAQGNRASVVIHNTNTRKLIRATFALEDGVPAEHGDLALDGVAGTGAPIELAFLDPAGAATGRLLPTGNRTDILDLPGFGSVGASLVDVCNPVVFLSATLFGLSGTETADELAADTALLTHLEDARAAAAVAMGLVSHLNEAHTLLRNLPLVALVAAPAPGDDVQIRTWMFSSGQPHKASPLTAGMCLAAAAAIPGTVANALAMPVAAGAAMRIRHVSGVLEVSARGNFLADEPSVDEAIVLRTARKLMEGRVYF